MTASPAISMQDRRVIALAALGLVFLVVFSLAAIAVRPPTQTARWDEPTQAALADAAERWPALYHASAILTHLADKIVLLLLALAGAILVARREPWRFALYWLLTTYCGMFAIDVIKQLVARTRPPIEDTAAMSPSFPSGHAGGAMLVGGMLAYLLLRADHRAARWTAVPILLLVFPIGLTRIVLGLHWLSDVIGGWLFGAGWALAGIALLEAWQRYRRQPAAPSPAQ